MCVTATPIHTMKHLHHVTGAKAGRLSKGADRAPVLKTEPQGAPASGVERILLTNAEASRALGISRITLHRLVRRGLIRPVYLTSVAMYAPEELRRVVRERQRA